MSLTSVIIPSYNHQRYVQQAIRSVLESDYDDFELIIIDDGSTDGSPSVIRETIADDRGRRISFVEQPNAGAPMAIMRGISRARGQVLTILNSDDFYDRDRLSTIIKSVPNDGDFLAFSQVRYIDDAGVSLEPETPQQSWYLKALREAAECPTVGYGLLRNNFAATTSNLVFTRALYEKIGGFSDYKLCHDWDFLLRATHYVEPIYVPQPLMSYRVHQSNTVNSSLHLFLTEGVPALNSYIALGLSETPPNPLAPGWTNWPAEFDDFINRYASWFFGEPMGNFIRYRPPYPATRSP